MKQFVNCPVCGEVMETSFGGVITLKECKKNPSHNIKFISNDHTDEVSKISIRVRDDPAIWATWHILSEELRIHRYSARPLSKILGDPLPWFEPDLSDYYKLVDKIRTYILFS